VTKRLWRADAVVVVGSGAGGGVAALEIAKDPPVLDQAEPAVRRTPWWLAGT
jgi:aspartate oxidase